MFQPRGCHLRAPIESLWRTTSWGTQCGQLDGRSDGHLLTGVVRSPVGRVLHLVEAVPTWLSLTSALFREGCAAVAVGSLRRPVRPGLQDSYLVDSASSHMLVSKIKPCMSKYKQSYCETANGSLNQLSFI